MNNFNNVFKAVKNRCKKTGTFPVEMIDEIANEAKIPAQSAGFYLDCLKDIGLIEFSGNKKNIVLTDMGKKRDEIFMPAG